MSPPCRDLWKLVLPQCRINQEKSLGRWFTCSAGILLTPWERGLSASCVHLVPRMLCVLCGLCSTNSSLLRVR